MKISALLSLAIIFILWLFITEPGLQFSYVIIQKFIPGKFSIGELKGSWHRKIILKNFYYQDDNLLIKADQIQYALPFAKLILPQHINLNYLSAEHATIDVKTDTWQGNFTGDIYPNKIILNQANLIILDEPVLISPSEFYTQGFLGINQIKINFTSQKMNISHRKTKLMITPHLELYYHDPILKLTGNILIPSAEINWQPSFMLETLPNNAIIIRQQKPTSTTLPLQFYGELALALGQDIYFHTPDFDANIHGDLALNITPNQLLNAMGELIINKGTYRAYGTSLNIKTGRLIFNHSPLNNPGLNIRAEKSIEITQSSPKKIFTLGINIHDFLAHPKLTLFSEPELLSDADILSYLLLGVPTQEASSAQTQILIQAAESMGISGTQAIAEIQNTFGLSELRLGSNKAIDPKTAKTTQNTTLILGKQITPKLQASYSTGLSTPLNILRLTYQLTHRLALQTETTAQSSAADILYTIETK
jgi:autotransporter translocation and assembly factor TamB